MLIFRWVVVVVVVDPDQLAQRVRAIDTIDAYQ